MKYQQLIGLVALSGFSVTALPVSEDNEAQGVTLWERERPIADRPQYCGYGKSTKTGTSNKLVQVSDTLPCSNGGCEVSVGTEHTFGIEVNFGIGGELSKGLGAISAEVGVTLSESWTNSKTSTCTAEAGETVCIWANVPYVNVHLSDRGTTDLRNPGPCTNPEEVDAKIPLGKGGWYCVRGATNCREDGGYYWVENQ